MDLSFALILSALLPLAFAMGARWGTAPGSRRAIERQREEQFRIAVEASPAGLLLVDTNGVIELVNSAVEESFGYSREELIGRGVEMLVPEEARDRHPGWVAAFLREPRRLTLGAGRDLQGRHKNGSHFPVEIGLNPIETPEGLRLLVSVLDVTERRRDEHALREKTVELEHSNRELEQFASVVSHDLKSPLRGISSLAEWIAADYADVLDDEGREHLELLRERTIRMHSMIGGILAYSRAARGTDLPGRVETSELVDAVVEMLAPPPNVEIRVEEPLPDCTCNETQLSQVFQNLIGNAIQHLGKPRGTITISGEAGPKRATFTVRDDGIGIAPEHHARIFKIFQTLHADPKERSTGIGLSIVRKIVERNGGELEVESEPGRGTAFKFSMPGAK